MKKILVSLVLFLPFILTANGDSRIIYNSSLIPQLPKEGTLQAKDFCYDEDKDSFLVNTKARITRVCIRSRTEYTGRGPIETCLESEAREIPAKTFYISRFYQSRECVKWDRSSSSYPKCLKYDKVTKKHSLFYRENTYQVWDYRRSNPDTELKEIPYCTTK